MMYPKASLAMLAIGGSLLLSPGTPMAAPAREALVIGNGTYGGLPPLPACLLSAHAVASALRTLGFQIVERDDLTTGGTDAAISEFSQHLAASPGASAFVYSCGYATSFNDRPFMLPVSARITRPADVLTQGVLAKLLIDVLIRGGAGSSVVAIDVVPAPDHTGALGLDSLTKAALPDGLGMIAVSQAKPPDAPTPLATTLIAGLKGPEVLTLPLLADVQQQIGGKSVTLAALRLPVALGFLAGGPSQPSAPAAGATSAASPPAPSTPTPQVATAPSSPASPAPASSARPASPQSPRVTLPDEEQMTEVDRKSVQTALERLGYYPGPIDGKFGPDTRAAIRRYQHELGTEMTGRLSAAQATRLANGQ